MAQTIILSIQPTGRNTLPFLGLVTQTIKMVSASLKIICLIQGTLAMLLEILMGMLKIIGKEFLWDLRYGANF